MRTVLSAVGLPEIDRDAAPRWSLVVPVSDALQEGDSAVAAAPRSSRSLQRALERLLSVAAALADPEANTKLVAMNPHLAVAVPGPSGFPRGTFETDHVGRLKGVLWAPDEDISSTQALAVLAGRSEGFRYRWDDKGVWEQLAHDMIVVACGWKDFPQRLPPVLAGRASTMLGQQVRRDLGATAEWAVHTQDIVRWLARSGLVAVLPMAEEPWRHAPPSVEGAVNRS